MQAYVCLTTDTWLCLKRLTDEARYLQVVRQGHLDVGIWQHQHSHASSSWTPRFVKLTLWYEIPINFKLSVSYRSPLQYAECNINIHMWARHEHQGLWNLLFGMKYLSVLSFQFYTDHHSKMMNATSRLAVRIHWRAVHFVMQFLVTQFDSLTDLRKHVSPEEQAFPPTKTDVAPMRILFQDEKYTSENDDILKQQRMRILMETNR